MRLVTNFFLLVISVCFDRFPGKKMKKKKEQKERFFFFFFLSCESGDKKITPCISAHNMIFV